MVHRFKSNYFENGYGFQLRYEATNVAPQMTYRIGECGGNFTTTSGIMTSPLYPENYPPNTECFYTISAPDGNIITLNFHHMDIRKWCRSDCDYLEVRDGTSENATLIERSSGNQIPDTISSSQGNLWMK